MPLSADHDAHPAEFSTTINTVARVCVPFESNPEPVRQKVTGRSSYIRKHGRIKVFAIGFRWERAGIFNGIILHGIQIDDEAD